jgi:hypothetical protein
MFLRLGLVIGMLMASSHPSLAQGFALDANQGSYLHLVLTIECFHPTPVKYSDGSIDKKPGKALTQVSIGFKHLVWGADGKLKSASGIEPKVEGLLHDPMDVVSDLQNPLVKDGVLILTLKQVGQIHVTPTTDQHGTLAEREGCMFIPMTPISVNASPQPPVVLKGLVQEGHDSGLWESDESSGKYLRFYSNGTVTRVLTAGTTHATGRYTLSGATVKFSLISPDGTVDYDGLLRNNSLSLNWFSHINNRRGTEQLLAVPEMKDASTGRWFPKTNIRRCHQSAKVGQGPPPRRYSRIGSKTGIDIFLLSLTRRRSSARLAFGLFKRKTTGPGLTPGPSVSQIPQHFCLGLLVPQIYLAVQSPSVSVSAPIPSHGLRSAVFATLSAS